MVPNCGRKGDLIINGHPIDQGLGDHTQFPGDAPSAEGGSIVVVLATNAPLSSRQLLRIAKRAVIGIGRTGSIVSHGSGDFVIAFSTARPTHHERASLVVQRTQLWESQLTPLFGAAVESTEEAILNALCMATTMTGRDKHTAEALPMDRIMQIVARS